jgi:hypothetical protein
LYAAADALPHQDDGTRWIRRQAPKEVRYGVSVLARLHLEGRLAAAGVVGHAQAVEDQTDVARQALDGRGDGIAGLGSDGTDGEAA